MKKRIYVLLLIAALFLTLLTGCVGAGKAISTGTVGVIHDMKFGNVLIDMPINDFNELGFSFGDSVNVSFSNGKNYSDIPYYSGYYSPIGDMLLCGYPGNDYVVIARTFGASTWEEFELTESSQVTVTLNEKGKYLTTQELFALQYSDERENFDSDVIFANFRELCGGTMKQQTFFRSASPCDNQHKRASCANALAESHGIRFVLNLSDNEEKYRSYTQESDFDSAYYDSLYRNGDVLLLAMDVNYHSDVFAGIISEALFTMTEHSGPCLIHCVEGKDRTGFVCALMLALADASPQEIIDDFMITYYNYYGITLEDDPERYDAVETIICDFLYYMCSAEHGTSFETMDLKAGGEAYLRRGGLSDEQIEQIEAYLKE